MESSLENKIDLFLKGDLPAQEQAALEARMEADPAFRQEVEFQSLVRDGLGQFRKNQLKARLEGVDLAPTWSTFLQQSTFIKSLGGIVAASLIGGVIYTSSEYVDESETAATLPVSTIVVDAPFEEETSRWILPAEASVAVAQEAVKDEPPQVIDSFEAPVLEEAESAEFNPNIEAPNAGDVSDNNVFKSQTPPPVLTETQAVAASDDPLDVEVKNVRTEKVKYRFYDGKLFLYGQFASTPYEILDINGAEGRRLYLFHQNRYFELPPSDKTISVDPIEQGQLIEELELIRRSRDK